MQIEGQDCLSSKDVSLVIGYSNVPIFFDQNGLGNGPLRLISSCKYINGVRESLEFWTNYGLSDDEAKSFSEKYPEFIYIHSNRISLW